MQPCSKIRCVNTAKFWDLNDLSKSSYVYVDHATSNTTYRKCVSRSRRPPDSRIWAKGRSKEGEGLFEDSTRMKRSPRPQQPPWGWATSTEVCSAAPSTARTGTWASWPWSNAAWWEFLKLVVFEKNIFVVFCFVDDLVRLLSRILRC